jgi:hypothetical protein
MTEVIIDRARLVRWSIVVLGLFAAAAVLSQAAGGTASARAQETQPIAVASQAEDEAVILPTRVSAAIGRSLAALDRAEARVDDQQYSLAAASLVAVGADLGRADRAGLTQLRAVPVDPEAESTSGPDSVTAVLTLDQSAITRLAGLYDTVTDPVVLNRIGSSLNAALAKRNRMLNAVIALDPEGAGVAYADAMADTLDGYTDEVANLTEALKVDRLTTSARSALTNALSRSQAAAAKVNAAFGGGE